MKRNCLSLVSVGNETVALVRGRVIKNSVRTGESASGVAFAHFALSVSECDRSFEYLCKKLDANPDMKNEYNGKTSYIVRVTAFRYNADFVKNYLNGEQIVYVQCLGTITKDSYNGKDNLNMTIQAIEFADDNGNKAKLDNEPAQVAASTPVEENTQATETIDIDLSDLDF